MIVLRIFVGVSIVLQCFHPAVSSLLRGHVSNREIMPWMCLERCQNNATAISNHLKQLVTHPQLFRQVAFESYNLGADSTLVQNNLTSVGPSLAHVGIQTIPMVSSYPYPPQFLSWMRQVFANPAPFFKQTLKACIENKWNGVNIDWEPTNNKEVTPQDAVNYANFLDKLAIFLKPHNIQVTVDVATWSPIWNLALINATSVHRIMTMSTYTDNQASWNKALSTALGTISLDKLSIGLETLKTDGSPYSVQELRTRFAALKEANVQSISLWSSPVPDVWMPFLYDWIGQ